MKLSNFSFIMLFFSLFLLNTCFSIPFNFFGSNDSTSLKYPVVLVHGIVAHDREGYIGFWGRIPDVLRNNGVKVYLGNTDSFGSIESNAGILKNTIETVLLETGADKVNIIAHSKGGIDSRYMIWHYDFGDKVASLTTIGTPHHGAEIADVIARQNILSNSEDEQMVMYVFSRLYGDQNPDMYKVLIQLTTNNMIEFNQNVIPDERVFYQSFYSAMRSGFDDMLFFSTFHYINLISGENDGVVSKNSAQWGNNPRKISDSGISHRQIIDVEIMDSGLYVPALYLNIVNELGRKGF